MTRGPLTQADYRRLARMLRDRVALTTIAEELDCSPVTLRRAIERCAIWWLEAVDAPKGRKRHLDT